MSLAQILPAPILEAIAEIVLDGEEPQSTMARYSLRSPPVRTILSPSPLPPRETLRNDVLSLSSVCQHWRAIARSTIFRTMLLCLDNIHEKCTNGTHAHGCDASIVQLDSLKAFSCIRTAKLHIPCFMIASSYAPATVEAALPVNTVFSSVTSLTISTTCTYSINLGPLDGIQRGVEKLALVLRRLFPNAVYVHFEYHIVGKLNVAGDTLVTSLHRLMGPTPAAGPAQMLHPRSLHMTRDTTSGSALGIVHRYAETLVHLNLKEILLKLFQEDGSPVIFKSLETLYIDCRRKWPRRDESVPKSPPEIVVFPALQSFTCKEYYPYQDDVVFRGNSKTLKHVEIELSSELARILDSVELVGLDRLTFSAMYSVNDQPFATALASVLKSGRHATAIRCKGMNSLPFSMCSLSVFPSFTTLRVLHLPKLECTLNETLRILTALPHLVHLGLSCLSMPEFEEVDDEHALCAEVCYAANNSGRVPFSYRRRTRELGNLEMFILLHFHIICDEAGYLGKTIRQYYPLAPALTSLLLHVNTPNNMTLYRATLVLYILCPAIRLIKIYINGDWESSLSSETSQFHKQFFPTICELRSKYASS